MRKRGTTVINQPEEQRAQSMLMLADRLSGASVKTLGARYSCSRRTVLRRLALARGSGLVEDAKAHIVETLVPKALHVFNQALESGDVSVATDVLFGTGALLKNPQPLSTTTEETTDEIDTIEAYRSRTRPPSAPARCHLDVTCATGCAHAAPEVAGAKRVAGDTSTRRPGPVPWCHIGVGVNDEDHHSW